MRIMMIRANPVNPDPRVEKECYTLIKNKHVVEVLAWDREKNYSVLNEFIIVKDILVSVYRFGIKSEFGGGIKSNLFPLAIFQIKIFLWLFKNQKRYDVIHACDFTTAFISFLAAKLLNKKIVYDIFDYYVDSFSVPRVLKPMIRKIDQFIIQKVNAVIICSEKRKKQLGVDKIKRLAVVHNSSDLFCCNNLDAKKENNEMVKIVYVGILQEGRFIREVIDAVLKKENCELHIAGFGQLENEILSKSNQCNRVYFYGKISYARTLQLENECDIMTAIYDPQIPNHFFAAPNKFYEALMLGKPLIMVKNTGMDHIVSKYNIGKVIDFNIANLERAIDELIDQRDKWEEMSKTMRGLYKEKYSWNVMEKRLIDLYSSL